eukprot:XP_001693278.1 predicted protein [Chlamydomonas reinhardtii]
MPPAPQSAAAMLRATSFRAPAPATISSASQYLLDSSLVPPYPAAATVAVSASQLSLPSVDFRRASFSVARGGGAAGGTGGLPGLGQSSHRHRSSVEAMIGQAPLPSGGSFSGAGSRASVELPYAVAPGAGAATSVPAVTSGTGAGITSNVNSCGTSGASLFKKLQQLNLPISECGVPELLSPVASPRATLLAGSTLFAPGQAATTSQRTQSMQHSPSFQRRSVTSTTSSAQHTFVDGAAAHIASGAMQPTASMADCGADALQLSQAGTGGSSSGASARRSSLHMPPSAAPSLSALRSQSFRHGGVGGSVSRTSTTGPGCGTCATTAAAITNEHADVAPEDNDDDKFGGELDGVEASMLERRVASMGPMPGGAATSLMASLLRRADGAIAASAPPTGGSSGATPNAASGPAMFVGAVDVADVVASGASEADALLSPLPPGGGASGAGSRHVSGAAAFVSVGALCGSPSSRRLTATQLTPPLLVSPVGHRAATLLQSHNSFGHHALSPTPPPAGPLAPQPPHGVLGAAATVDGSQSPAAGGAVASPSYLSQHRRMSFRASSSTTACGTPGSGFSGGAAFVI